MIDRDLSSISLSRREITKLVNHYIGVSGGYLGDFSYRTHADFYHDYCNLDINPSEYEGTTRERFIAILSSLPPRDQAAVVRGVIDRFPVGEGPSTRTVEVRNEFLQIIQRLEAGTPVPTEVLQVEYYTCPVHQKKRQLDGDHLNHLAQAFFVSQRDADPGIARAIRWYRKGLSEDDAADRLPEALLKQSDSV